MTDFLELKPGVYKVVKRSKKENIYDIHYVKEKYQIKKKIYGQVHKLLYRMKRKIELNILDTLSVLFLGGKGMGKTTTMEYASNKLIEAGLPVIEIKYIDVNIELIEFMSNLKNVVIQIDEFGKYFSTQYQDKMLTLLNADPDFKRVFLLGENEAYKISQYIIDRMERARYLIHLNRIADNDMLEYCKDNNFTKDITDSLLLINKKSSAISYDTLSVVADEHSIFPEMTFSELTEIMNCQGILGVPVIDIKNISLSNNDDYYVDKFDNSSGSTSRGDFLEKGARQYITVTLKKIKKDEVKEEPIQNNRMPFPGYDTNEHRVNITIQATEDMRINDIDDTIDLSMRSGGYDFDVLIGTKVISKSAIGRSPY